MSKEEFYQSINADTPFTYQFCKKLYGYSMYDEQFLRDVMDKFKSFGRDKVQYIFGLFLFWELNEQKETMQPIAQQISDKIDRDYERKVKETEWQKKQELLERKLVLLMQKSQT